MMTDSNSFKDFRNPPQYRPYLNGVYQVAPLLRPFGSTKENDEFFEKKVFQIDSSYPEYREVKLASLSENYKKYFGTHKLTTKYKMQTIDFMSQKLCEEYPEIFSLDTSSSDLTTLSCSHSGDQITWDNNGDLQSAIGPATQTLQALSLQIQEDFSVWRFEDNQDWMALGSICFPNHWDPSEKVGQDFFTVHAPVAGSAPMNKNAKQIVQTMIKKGPFVRFAWGISTDTRLNHHPEPAPGIDTEEWAGRAFNPDMPHIWVRYERQSLHGFPELEMAFFTIRTYFEDVHEIKKEDKLKDALKSALRSMTPASLEYKGLTKSLDSIIKWIDD